MVPVQAIHTQMHKQPSEYRTYLCVLHEYGGGAGRVADADAPAPGRATYDVVLAFNLLHLVADLDAAIASAAAALRPGGLFISKTACISEMNVLVPKVLLPLMRLVGKAPPVLCFAAPELQAALTRHGFEVEAVERHGTKGKDIRVFIVARKRGAE